MKPRKVAGTSFEIALSRYAEAGDIITPITDVDEHYRQSLGFRVAQNYRYTLGDITKDPKKLVRLLSMRRLPKKFSSHLSAADARDRLGAEKFDEAVKVSIVRNPFDLLVSLYYWRMRKMPSPLDFHLWFEGLDHSEFQNMNEKSYFIRDKLIVDYFIRYEFLNEDIMNLEIQFPKLTGLSNTFPGIKAKGGYRPNKADTASHFNGRKDLIEAVLKGNRWACDRFGYCAP